MGRRKRCHEPLVRLVGKGLSQVPLKIPAFMNSTALMLQFLAKPSLQDFEQPTAAISHEEDSAGELGGISLLPVKQFVITEATLGSGLSGETKNAPVYDQVSWKVACMAYMLGIKA